MKLDIIATRPHYIDHIASVWEALPVRRRGRVVIRENARARADALGLPTTTRDGGRNPALVSSMGDLARANRHPRPIALMNHGIGGIYGRARRRHIPDAPGVSLFLFASEYAASWARAAYPSERIEVTGSPFVDWLPRKEPGPQTVAISFHWRTHRMTPEKQPAIDHYKAILPELAQRFHVIGHGHPKSIEEYGPMWEAMGVEFVPEFTDVCRRADVYVCDTSSSIYEFAATGRPVVLLNAPWYRRHINQGVMRFWSGADVGIQVDEPDQLAGAIAEALLDAPERRAKREAVVFEAFAHQGEAASVTADALLDWMNESRRLAA